jgi:serine/threonine-protein kinase
MSTAYLAPGRSAGDLVEIVHATGSTAGAKGHGRRAADAASRESRQDGTPLTVGPWHLVRQVGEGLLTRVYLARPANLPDGAPCHYAVKLLRPQWEEEPSAVAALRREALLGLQVSHPRLVSVLSSRVERAPYYLVMPYLEGSCLAQQLCGRAAFSLAGALWVARQVAQALAALHRAGWLHLDVKPENVMISPAGHATLLDMGFARRFDEVRTAVDRPVMGTLNYMPPEMLSSRVACDVRSDLYSLGAMLFELLAGRPPILARDAEHLVTMHRTGVALDIDVLAADLPLGVRRLVRSLVSKQPDRRPASADEVVRQLARLEVATFADRQPLCYA